MRPAFRCGSLVCLCGVLISCAPTVEGDQRDQSLLQELVALERAALDRWIRLDPDGYLGAYAPDVTYFDPNQARRVDGVEAMQTLLAPMRGMKSPVSDPRYEMISPKVQRYGETALLTFNIESYGKLQGQPEAMLARWNSTEVYQRLNGTWKIVHSHWSYTQPKIQQPAL
jgi:ketosteroid isomerase-like protein